MPSPFTREEKLGDNLRPPKDTSIERPSKQLCATDAETKHRVGHFDKYGDQTGAATHQVGKPEFIWSGATWENVQRMKNNNPKIPLMLYKPNLTCRLIAPRRFVFALRNTAISQLFFGLLWKVTSAHKLMLFCSRKGDFLPTGLHCFNVPEPIPRGAQHALISPKMTLSEGGKIEHLMLTLLISACTLRCSFFAFYAKTQR